MSYDPIQAIIWDLDGLLLNTEIHYDTVMTQFAGRPVPIETRARMFGLKPIDSAKLFVEAMGVAMTPEEYLEKRQPILAKLFATSDLLPGADRLIRHFHAHGIPQAIATSSKRDFYAIKISRHRALFDLISEVVTAEDVTQGKPHPAAFLKAAEKLQQEPAACLVFEDAPNGVQAARAAGMSVIAVPDARIHQQLVVEADQVLRSLQDFAPAPWGLPALPA